TRDVAESASKFHEAMRRCESGAQQQFARPAIVNFADHPQPVVVASSSAQQVLVANCLHEGSIRSHLQARSTDGSRPNGRQPFRYAPERPTTGKVRFAR